MLDDDAIERFRRDGYVDDRTMWTQPVMRVPGDRPLRRSSPRSTHPA